MYWYALKPKGVESKYELLVFKNDIVFMPLTIYFDYISKKISKGSANTYLNKLIPYLNWQIEKGTYRGEKVEWDSEPDGVRSVIEDYLSHEMFCKIKEKESFNLVNLTKKSPNTVKVFLSAVKSFYNCLIKLEYYRYTNPLIDSFAKLNSNYSEGVRENKPRLPEISGTEEEIKYRRLTNSYFKVVNEEWEPQIIDDSTLPYQVYNALKNSNVPLVNVIVTRMLFETGARVSEVIELTIGDFRARRSFQEAVTFNKGSYGKRIKFIRFSKETVKLLKQYVEGQRKALDSNNLGFEALPDNAPMFLNSKGYPLKYHTWYYHWTKSLKENKLAINPHKTRHWFVTTRLREIYNISKSDVEIDIRKNELINYMKWRNKDTINVYEHYFDELRHREAHDKMLEDMQNKEREFNKNPNTKAAKLIENLNPMTVEFDEDLKDLLEGLD
ncbi:tyrosine-type recombinase/integrase [Lysinibacillus capsici]|uniref:tyrosine-type recombinase/integrase n=1 Tax=Lysinibacillus capsici TaxID=2115968 RepID=UPI0029DE8217|nr:tyrosine-type recombinase/integrase [Lysinibacillus capsici]WPK03937.1 tyrosine-type recombinase/integrase [Lysinibacillus capsici]